MKITFSFELKTDDKEIISRTVEFDAEDNHRAKVLAVQIIRQLENSKLDNEFNYIYREGLCSSNIKSTSALKQNP